MRIGKLPRLPENKSSSQAAILSPAPYTITCGRTTSIRSSPEAEGYAPPPTSFRMNYCVKTASACSAMAEKAGWWASSAPSNEVFRSTTFFTNRLDRH